jgi:hypothetical protein
LREYDLRRKQWQSERKEKTKSFNHDLSFLPSKQASGGEDSIYLGPSLSSGSGSYLKIG